MSTLRIGAYSVYYFSLNVDSREKISSREIVIAPQNDGESIEFSLREDGVIVRKETIPIKFIMNYTDMLEKAFLYLDSVVRS